MGPSRTRDVSVSSTDDEFIAAGGSEGAYAGFVIKTMRLSDMLGGRRTSLRDYAIGGYYAVPHPTVPKGAAARRFRGPHPHGRLPRGDRRAGGAGAGNADRAGRQPYFRQQSGLHGLLSQAYGLPRYDAASLADLAKRIRADASVRAAYTRYYAAGAADTAINASNWAAFACAQTALTPDAFAACACPAQ